MRGDVDSKNFIEIQNFKSSYTWHIFFPKTCFFAFYCLFYYYNIQKNIRDVETFELKK